MALTQTLEEGLKISNAPSDGKFLQYKDSTDKLTWATVSQPDADKIIEGDTSVEAIDTGTDGNILFKTDNTERLRVGKFGSNNGIFIPESLPIRWGDIGGTYTNCLHIHGISSSTGTPHIISSGYNDIKIEAGGVGNNVNTYHNLALFKHSPGSGTSATKVELYASNTKRFETSTTGVTVTGTVAATAYTGDGSALTGIAALTGSTDNTITTVTGANAIQGESNLTFDGEAMSITHEGTDTPENQLTLDTSAVTDGGGSGIFFKNSGATGNAHLNRYGTRLHTVRGSNGASTFKISNEKTGGLGLVEAVSIDPDQNVKVTTGNLVIGTAGKGIDFSIVGNDAGGMTQELLDDYEEGTWTPACSDVTFSSLSGNYTKIGRMVWINFSCTGATAGSGSDTIEITGIPYQANQSARFMPEFYKVDFSADYSDLCCGVVSGTDIQFLRLNSTSSGGSGNWVQATHVGSSGQIHGSAVYCTDY